MFFIYNLPTLHILLKFIFATFKNELIASYKIFSTKTRNHFDGLDTLNLMLNLLTQFSKNDSFSTEKYSLLGFRLFMSRLHEYLFSFFLFFFLRVLGHVNSLFREIHELLITKGSNYC